MATRAVIFDFNGTLSDDEPVLCRIYCDLFAEHGRPIAPQHYYDELAGHSEEAIAHACLGEDDPRVPAFVAERIARYRAAVADGSTVPAAVRDAVRYAGARVPLAIVSGAAREEIEPVVSAAGLAGLLATIVPADDVVDGKPHPEGYLRALDLLGDGIRAGEVAVFEDTEAGVASAKAAGMRCLAVLGTLPAARLAAADEIVERIDVPLMQRLLG